MRKTTLPGSLRARLGSLAERAEAETERTIKDILRPKARPKPPRPRPTRPKTRAESFKDLDLWLDEATAGMPDEALARAANVSLTAVLEWRKERGVKRKKGRASRREADVWAVDAFGDGYVHHEIHETSSQLKGLWDLPEYVLRVPLDYDELSRALFFLHHEQGTAPDALAKAFGLRERDVEMAIAVETAHLQRVGIACKKCGRPCDPAYGTTCSTRCRGAK